MPSRKTNLTAAILLASVALSTTPAQGQWRKILGKLGKKEAGLTDEKMASGLKEALRVGTGKAVEQTGREDGYFSNELIRILLPEELKRIERPLRLAGQGEVVDEFVLSMNRAAERAAPKARDIFWNAILQMTFTDVKRIFQGGDTAATDFFREKTTAELTEAFRPIVAEALEEVGATQQYNRVQRSARSVPFLRMELVELDEYVVGKALEGLFHVLGEEEKKIRTDPAARVTDLLKEVFGRGD